MKPIHIDKRVRGSLEGGGDHTFPYIYMYIQERLTMLHICVHICIDACENLCADRHRVLELCVVCSKLKFLLPISMEVQDAQSTRGPCADPIFLGRC